MNQRLHRDSLNTAGMGLWPGNPPGRDEPVAAEPDKGAQSAGSRMPLSDLGGSVKRGPLPPVHAMLYADVHAEYECSHRPDNP